jgi:phospholipid N-methyltransferase
LGQTLEQESRKIRRKKRRAFFRESVRNLRITGTITPSWEFLVRKMVEPIDFEEADCIVEFGAGDGVITKELLRNMRPDCKLLSFEVNEKFFEHLKSIKDDRLIRVFDSAENVVGHLKENGINNADYIVSGLPLAIFPKELTDRILTAANDALDQGGLYVQFQYSLTSLRTLRKRFSSVEYSFVPINLPPAFVYVCEK